MRKKIPLFLLCTTLHLTLLAQSDSAKMSGIFMQLTKDVQDFVVDTSAVPEDRITAKIRELRALRGGFNINEAIAFKLGEEEQKGETPKATIQYLREQFTSGKGMQWLDNATIWIYRKQFTYTELRQLVRFYRTSAGQKMALQFPSIMLKTLKAGQLIHDTLMKDAPQK